MEKNMRNDVAGALRRLELGSEAGSFTAEFSFNRRLPVFQGHFPQRPLLPGVLQIEMVRYAAEQNLGYPCDIAEISKTKFRGEIKPEDTIIVNVAVSKESHAMKTIGNLLVGQAVAATISLTLIRRSENQEAKAEET
jgi:3-hydroxyacyl-[acyl-carrier-protein] dehydratase